MKSASLKFLYFILYLLIISKRLLFCNETFSLIRQPDLTPHAIVLAKKNKVTFGDSAGMHLSWQTGVTLNMLSNVSSCRPGSFVRAL